VVAAVQHRLLKVGHCRALQDIYSKDCTIEVLLLCQRLPFNHSPGLNPCVDSVMCAGPCRIGAATKHTSPVAHG
jgi:hypothetical protein